MYLLDQNHISGADRNRSLSNSDISFFGDEKPTTKTA